MPPPSYPRFDHSNYTRRRVQITQLLVMQFSPPSCHLYLCDRNILLSTLSSNTQIPPYSPNQNAGGFLCLRNLQTLLARRQSPRKTTVCPFLLPPAVSRAARKIIQRGDFFTNKSRALFNLMLLSFICTCLRWGRCQYVQWRLVRHL
jgi:hypothetical protein